MNFVGLDNKGVLKFNLNRKLTKGEVQKKLDKNISISSNPNVMFNVVRANNSYIEIVDRWYADKGMPSFFACCLSFITLFVIIVQLTTSLQINEVGSWGVMFFALVIFCLPCGFIAYKLFSLEILQKTYYPVIFNRTKGKVFFMLPKEEALELQWESLFIYIDEVSAPLSGTTYELKGHLLSSDGQTVLKTISMSGSPVNNKQDIQNYWEFLRRYMNKRLDSKTLIKKIKFCLPISGPSENFKFSVVAGMAMMGSSSILKISLSPVLCLITLSRLLVIKLSNLPEWPLYIDSQLDKHNNDRSAKDSNTNPEFDKKEVVVSMIGFYCGLIIFLSVFVFLAYLLFLELNG